MLLQRLGLAVQHGARLLAAQHDQLERVDEDLVELTAFRAEPDRQQRRQRVLGRACVRAIAAAAELQAGIEIGAAVGASPPGRNPSVRAVAIWVSGCVR